MYISKRTDPERLAKHIEETMLEAMYNSKECGLDRLGCLWKEAGHADIHFDNGRNALVARLLESNLDHVTYFNNKNRAELGVLKLIAKKAPYIADKFTNGEKCVELKTSILGNPIGFGLTDRYEIIQSNKMRVIIDKDSEGIAACGFILKTAYPGGSKEDVVSIGRFFDPSDIVNNQNGFHLSPAQRIAAACRELTIDDPDVHAHCYASKTDGTEKTYRNAKITIGNDEETAFEINVNSTGIAGKYKFEKYAPHSYRALMNFMRDNEKYIPLIEEIDNIRRRILQNKYIDLSISKRAAGIDARENKKVAFRTSRDKTGSER